MENSSEIKTKPFNLEHAIKSRRAKTVDGKTSQLIQVISDSGMLEWTFGGYAVLTDLDGKVDGKEYLYSAEVEKTNQIFYLVKTLQMVDYALVHGKDDYPKYNIRYAITLNIEDGEIKSIEHAKVQ